MSENAERALKAIADGRAGLLDSDQVERQIAEYMGERWAEVRRLHRVAVKEGVKAAGVLLVLILILLLSLAPVLGII